MSRLFKIFAALSLLLCVAVCALWVRSYGLSDRVMWMSAFNAGSVHSAEGRIVLYSNHTDWRGAHNSYIWPFEGHGVKLVTLRAVSAEGAPLGLFDLGDQGDRRTAWQRGGNGFYLRTKRNGDWLLDAVVPIWGVALLTASPALLLLLRRFVRRVRARRRIKRGLCGACGYDLRATPAGGSCPECGTPSQFIYERKEWRLMKRVPLIAAFAGGFAAAMLITILIIVPIEKQRVRDQLNDDVYSPMSMAMVFTTETLARGQSQRAIEQLDTLAEKFNFYHNFGGPPPKEWAYQLFDRWGTTQPAKK